MTDDKKPREFKVQHRKIMCPDCSHVFTFESILTSDDYDALAKENAELKTLLLKKDEQIKLQLIGTDCINEGMSKLNAEITSLRESLKLAVEALLRISVNVENGENKRIAELCNEALATIKAKGEL
jgi:hypothetical protein